MLPKINGAPANKANKRHFDSATAHQYESRAIKADEKRDMKIADTGSSLIAEKVISENMMIHASQWLIYTDPLTEFLILFIV